MTVHDRELASTEPELSYPAPLPDEDAQDEAALACDRLAARRHMPQPNDGAGDIHLIASLICDLQFRLDEAIVLAADQEVAINDIARLAGITTTEVRQAIANLDPENDLAN